MSDERQQQECEEERFLRTVEALDEAVSKGVSQDAVCWLAGELGLINYYKPHAQRRTASVG